MNELTYIVEKDLLVMTIPTFNVSKETKEELSEQLKYKTGIKNVLVIEGKFEVYGSVDYAKAKDVTVFHTMDGVQCVIENE